MVALGETFSLGPTVIVLTISLVVVAACVFLAAFLQWRQKKKQEAFFRPVQALP